MDKAWEEGIGGDDDRSIISVSISIIEITLEIFSDWLDI